jgi:hypothetical protein
MTEIQIDFKAIKQWLSRGEIKKLAVEHGISAQHAYHILRGRALNPEFLDLAYTRALDRKTRIESGMKELEKKMRLLERPIKRAQKIA